jgi:hypothetical protein
MSNVIRLRPRVRPLTKTYQPDAPYVVERQDQEGGDIVYEVVDERPDSYRTVCASADARYGKQDTENIARGLNMLVQYGMEKLPKPKSRK